MRGEPADSETTEEFVTERLALGDSGETTAKNLLRIELKRVLGEFESFLNQGGEFADTATLFAEDLLSVGGTNDNLNEEIVGQEKANIAAVERTNGPRYVRVLRGLRSQSNLLPQVRE